MIFGNLNKVLEDEQNIYESIENIVKPQYENKSKFSKILKALSRYGMDYDEQIYKNMKAIPADKSLMSSTIIGSNPMYASLMNNWKIKPEEDKAFSEKSLNQKRDVLRKLALQPELEDILDIMTNECIVYDDEQTYIANPYLDNNILYDLNNNGIEEINNAMNTSFYKIYMLLNWKHIAWDDFKRFLIEGDMAFEIVYDDLENPKNVTGIIPVDAATLTKSIEHGTTYWIQYKGVIGQERKLLDSQIIYIKYQETGISVRQSYLERLIRPFNLYRIVEQAQVIWTVTQSSFKTMFTIPTAGLTKAKGLQTLSEQMSKYREDISFNSDTGELKINSKTNLPFNKEYWFPSNENGKPEIETLTDNGPQLNDSDQIKYFESKLYKISKIPMTRFDKDSQSTWFGTDATQTLREEIMFSRFVNRLRNVFGEILLKPLRIQISLLLPSLKNDKRILDAISLRFNSYNLFEEMMNIEVMTKRIEFIGTFKDSITITNADGEEESYFSAKFLIQKYLKMSEADLELNERFKLEEKLLGELSDEGEDETGEDEENDKAPDEDSEEDNDLLGGDENSEEENSESEPEDASDIDDEMLGDVKPESTETTQK